MMAKGEKKKKGKHRSKKKAVLEESRGHERDRKKYRGRVNQFEATIGRFVFS